jgi:hypothetical protein
MTLNGMNNYGFKPDVMRVYKLYYSTCYPLYSPSGTSYENSSSDAFEFDMPSHRAFIRCSIDIKRMTLFYHSDSLSVSEQTLVTILQLCQYI